MACLGLLVRFLWFHQKKKEMAEAIPPDISQLPRVGERAPLPACLKIKKHLREKKVQESRRASAIHLRRSESLLNNPSARRPAVSQFGVASVTSLCFNEPARNCAVMYGNFSAYGRFNMSILCRWQVNPNWVFFTFVFLDWLDELGFT